MDSILYIIIVIVAVVIVAVVIYIVGLLAWDNKKAGEFLNEHNQKAREFLPLIKDFVFGYSHITNSGSIVHVFHYLDKYTMAIWETNDYPFGFEVSIHSVKDNNKTLVLADGKDKVTNPIIFAALKNLSGFIAQNYDSKTIGNT